MASICLQAGHQNIQNNCDRILAGETGAPGERDWTPVVRGKVAALLRAQKASTGAAWFKVTEADANISCASVHPRYDLTLAIHYQSNTGHSGFGVFVPDPSVDRDNARSIVLARKLMAVYAARTKLPNYSDPAVKGAGATWSNPNTRFYYLWNTQNGPLSLIECGEGAVGAPDHDVLWKHEDLIASAIAEGICAGFGVAFVDPAVAAAAKAAADAKAKADALAAAAAVAKAKADAAAAAQAADAAAKQAAADAATAAAQQAAKDAAAAEHAAAAQAAANAPLPRTSLQDVLVALLKLLLGR